MQFRPEVSADYLISPYNQISSGIDLVQYPFTITDRGYLIDLDIYTHLMITYTRTWLNRRDINTPDGQYKECIESKPKKLYDLGKMVRIIYAKNTPRAVWTLYNKHGIPCYRALNEEKFVFCRKFRTCKQWIQDCGKLIAG